MRKLVLFMFALALALTARAQAVEGLALGNRAPEIRGTSPDGQRVKLSDLRGKYVLIDFWASWCGPCRAENPNVVAAYNNYKDASFKGGGKGFEVFSVSLDMNADKWRAAIAQDKLAWKSHVCDFGGWQSAIARQFGVHSIPSNLLLDEKGVILAYNLRGAALQAALGKFVLK